ncbi:hypothetical protein N8I77_000209 [Diaporthe amygdali]|uniref:Uncharacterized protein n=1 Tax=Phomopsis amygdali TaxID=1214568 RepID=A0AAD9SP47_PHOAM|nr:hypothetical protein N8I77_000209 [Diaporthe amygdali]
MLSFHSIAPARLTQATEKRPPPKPKPKPPVVMTDTHVASPSAVPEAIDRNGSAHLKDIKMERPGPVVPENQRDSGIDLSHDEVTQDAAKHEVPPTSISNPPEQAPHATTEVEEEHHEASQPIISSQEVAAAADDDAEAGPSNGQTSSNNPPPGDGAAIRPVPHRGESTMNAVGYRRNPETVIAFLVPLPKPTIQGSTLDITPKYFLYAPPPPHLVKPRKGKEKYARKAHRVWQQHVRRAKANAHNGKRVSLSALHSATVRGCIWASEKRKGDDDGVVFLGRIQPKTVSHLVMIHPWALSADQTPEEILKTFRAQITATKASSFVKIFTRKMGPEPKTLQISPKAIIDGTRGPRESESSEEDEEVVVGVVENEQPQASRRERIRASIDSAKRRNPVAAIKTQIHQRGRKRHRDGSPSADTAENAESGTDFAGGELEHYSEEEAPAEAQLPDADGEPFTGHQLGEIPEEGFLDHFEEAEEPTTAGPSNANQTGGGVLADSTDEAVNDSQASEHAKKGSRFQLTFYPSPAMDIMSRYVQQSCHTANAHAFPSPTAAPTAAGVLASIGWEPERRGYTDAEEQLEDENWQAREMEEDLAFMTTKAARAWEKQCRKYVRQSKGGRLGSEKKPGRFGILVARVRPQKEAKGKKREDQPETSEAEPSEKKGKAAGLKQRLATIKEKRSKKKTEQTAETDETNPAEKQSKKEKAQKAAGVIFFPVILILGIPILIGKGIASGFKKIKNRKSKTGDEAEDTEQQEQQAKTGRRAAMKQRLNERSGSVKRGLSTRGGAMKKRLADRKAKKASADEPTTAAAADATTAEAPANAEPQDDAADATSKKQLSKKQRLTAALLAGPLAIREALKKKRQSKAKSTKTTEEDSTPKEKKASKFSAAKERVKALRTKVNKETRFARLKARLRAFQESRKNKKNTKKNAKTTSTDDDSVPAAELEDSNNTTSVKKQGAIAGLVAGCVALPAAKVKQARDKRRRGKAADSVQGAAAAAREEHATASSLSVAADQQEFASAVSSQRGGSVRLVPSEPERLNAAVEQERFSPPENGQSEVPVQQAVRTEPDARPSSRGGDVNAAAASEVVEDQPERPAAAVRFRSIRDGIGNVKGGIGSGITNLKARRRGTGQTEIPAAEEPERPQAETMDSAETHVEADPSTVEPTTQSTTAQQDQAASGGRFKSIKGGIGSGIEGLKARRQREKKETPPQPEEPAATTAAAENEKKAAAAANKDAASGGRLKALKDGIANRKAKTSENDADEPVKTEKHKQQKQQPQKDWNSGIVDRMRWFLYAA